MTKWLSLIGLGENGVDGLSNAAKLVLRGADHVYGAKRHFDLIGSMDAELHAWPSPFDAMVSEVSQLKGEKVVVLATGDTSWYSVGNLLSKAFGADQMQVFPNVSAFQWAAARMGWALQNTTCLSVHGRAVEQINQHLQPRNRLLVLTSNGAAVTEIAKSLTDAGFGDSQLTALSHLGGENEQTFASQAKAWGHDVPDLNTLAIDCVAGNTAQVLAPHHSLPDTAFVHDGTMTKRDIRATTIAKLMPMPDALLWDVGAGCGSVAIEWMRAVRGAKAIGIEMRADRREMAQQNARALGGLDLQLIAGKAPEALAGLGAPDAIFIGGGLSEGVFEFCLDALGVHGRLVCNAITLSSEIILMNMHEKYGGSLTKLQIAQVYPVGSKRGWKTAMPVTQYSLVKS